MKKDTPSSATQNWMSYDPRDPKDLEPVPGTVPFSWRPTVGERARKDPRIAQLVSSSLEKQFDYHLKEWSKLKEEKADIQTRLRPLIDRLFELEVLLEYAGDFGRYEKEERDLKGNIHPLGTRLSELDILISHEESSWLGCQSEAIDLNGGVIP